MKRHTKGTLTERYEEEGFLYRAEWGYKNMKADALKLGKKWIELNASGTIGEIHRTMLDIATTVVKSFAEEPISSIQ